MTTFLKAARATLAAIRFAGRFSRGRLAINFALILFNGVVQVMGVASIAPFLAVAGSEGSIPALGKVPLVGSWLASMAHRDLLIVMGFVTILGLLTANFLMWLTERVRLRYGAFLIHALREGLMVNYCARPYGYYLAANSRVLYSFNRGDFYRLHAIWLKAGRAHSGMILSRQGLSVGE